MKSLTSLKNIFPLALIVLLLLYIRFAGPRNILNTLGWATGLLVVIAILSILALKVRVYFKNISLLILLLAGFIFLNHLASYIMVEGNAGPVNLLTVVLFAQPLAVIYGSFIALIDVIAKKSFSSESEEINISNILFFPVYLCIVSIYVIAFIVQYAANSSQAVSILVAIACATSISTLVYVKRLTFHEVEYILRPLQRNEDYAIIKRGLTSIVILMFFSLAFEHFRGFWYLGIVSMIWMTSNLFTLFHFYRHIFIPEPEHMEQPAKFHAFNIWSKRFLILNLVLGIIIFPLLWLIISTMWQLKSR